MNNITSIQKKFYILTNLGKPNSTFRKLPASALFIICFWILVTMEKVLMGVGDIMPPTWMKEVRYWQ